MAKNGGNQPPKLFPHHGSEQAGSLQKLQAGPARRESSGCSIWTWGSTDSHLQNAPQDSSVGRLHLNVTCYQPQFCNNEIHLGSETNRLGGLTQYTKLQTWVNKTKKGKSGDRDPSLMRLSRSMGRRVLCSTGSYHWHVPEGS